MVGDKSERTNSVPEGKVAHLVVQEVMANKGLVQAHFHSDPEMKPVSIAISSATRAHTNSHRRFRGNLIDKYMEAELRPGSHVIAQDIQKSAQAGMYEVRWLNHVVHPEKIHKGIISASGPRFADSHDSNRRLMPISYQLWLPNAKAVNGIEDLQNFTDFLDELRKNWKSHSDRAEKSQGAMHPLSWVGVKFRAITQDGVILALSPTENGGSLGKGEKHLPPSGQDVNQLYKDFTELVAKEHGKNVLFEAMIFREFYASQHLKNPNHYIMPILMDGRSKLGLHNQGGQPYLDYSDARFMGVERGLIVLSQPSKSSVVVPLEGFVESFYGYGIKPVYLSVLTQDDHKPRLQQGVLPTSVENEFTQHWLELMMSDERLFATSLSSPAPNIQASNSQLNTEEAVSLTDRNTPTGERSAIRTKDEIFELYTHIYEAMISAPMADEGQEKRRLENMFANFSQNEYIINDFWYEVHDNLPQSPTREQVKEISLAVWTGFAERNNIPLHPDDQKQIDLSKQREKATAIEQKLEQSSSNRSQYMRSRSRPSQ